MDNQKYRILSLDGGGSWALLQVMALQKMYGLNRHSYEVLNDFDLIVANSGGSLVAAAMAEGKPLNDILNMFMNETDRLNVFYKLKVWERDPVYSILRFMGIGPKYSTKKKGENLAKLLPQVSVIPMSQLPDRIGGRKPHFLISTFDFDRQRATFMRSDQTSKGIVGNIKKGQNPGYITNPKEVYITQAIHAASNAPINYFDLPAEFSYVNRPDVKHRYWDGAVGGYNNPAHAGLIEALVNGKKPEEIEIRSIGTGSVYLPLSYTHFKGYPGEEYLFEPYQKPGPATDIKKMVGSILSDPPDAANFICYSILNPTLPQNSNNYIRISPLIQPVLVNNRWVLPTGLNSKMFEALVKLDMDAIKEDEVELIHKLGELWLNDDVPNQPIRTDGDMSCVIGHGRFSKAAINWF
jgi:hypothetical protein